MSIRMIKTKLQIKINKPSSTYIIGFKKMWAFDSLRKRNEMGDSLAFNYQFLLLK